MVKQTYEDRREYFKAYNKWYRSTQNGQNMRRKAYQKWIATEKGKEANARVGKTWRNTEQGKIKTRLYAKRYYDKNKHRHRAKARVKTAIRIGILEPANSQSCLKCSCQAHDYHHYLGYEPKHWFDVIPLCIKCHCLFCQKT